MVRKDTTVSPKIIRGTVYREHKSLPCEYERPHYYISSTSLSFIDIYIDLSSMNSRLL